MGFPPECPHTFSGLYSLYHIRNKWLKTINSSKRNSHWWGYAIACICMKKEICLILKGIRFFSSTRTILLHKEKS